MAATSNMSRSKEFWLHDGSIVLAVEGTLFRVHQTILANHSEIFADLFSLPQSDNDGDTTTRIEGCPVITMHDSAEDFEDLLRAIYHPSHFDKFQPNSDLDVLLSFVGGILRLSTKYIIPELRRRCVAILVTRFPTTYQEYIATSPRPYTPRTSSRLFSPTVQNQSDWSSALTVTFVPTMSTVNGSSSSTTRYQMYPHPNPQISQTSLASPSASSSPPATPGSQPVTPPAPQQAAMTSNTYSNSSPSSFHYSRSRRSSHNSHHHDRDHENGSSPPPKPKTSSIMRAITLANETNIPTILPYAYYLLARTSDPRRLLSPSESQSTTSSLSSLSWHQKTIALVGRTHLHTASMALTHSFLVAFSPSPACTSPSSCAVSRGPLHEWALLCTTGRGPEPLRPWDRWDKLGVCSACVKDAKRRHEWGREQVWERLPDFFELECWRELRAAQA